MSELTHAGKYFATARERYRIKLKRDAGEPWPWTNDVHLKTWSFTNVHREDDRTTTWLRQNLRDPISNSHDENCAFLLGGVSESSCNCSVKLRVFKAVLIFRWFNRISTGEIIKDLILGTWDKAEAYRRLKDVKPVVTGAYIIKAGDGVSKLEGILNCIEEAEPYLPRMVKKWGDSLERAWEDLKELHYMGPFMAYEVITDLRFTPVLCNAKDIMTWGNLGPGAIRGMSWVVHNNADSFANSKTQQKQMLAWMAELLEMTKDEKYWPQAWPKWEMHEVEMWLCEHAKYMRAYNGISQKRRYHPGGND